MLSHMRTHSPYWVLLHPSEHWNKSLAKKLQSCTNQSFLIKATYKELSFLVDSGGPYGPSSFFLQAARLHDSASALHHEESFHLLTHSTRMVLIAYVGSYWSVSIKLRLCHKQLKVPTDFALWRNLSSFSTVFLCFLQPTNGLFHFLRSALIKFNSSLGWQLSSVKKLW